MALTAPGGREPPAFSEVLERLGHAGEGRLSVGEMVRAFGDRAFGAVMLMIAIIAMLPWPPGGTTIVGAPLLLLALELALGRETLWLPRWALNGAVDRTAYRRLTGRILPAIRFVERLSRPRLYLLTNSLAQLFIGFACLLLSVVLVLPIPLGNMAPAAAIAFFSLGVMQRDGVAVILGWLATAASAGLLLLVWATVWRLAQVAWAWVF